MTPLYLRIFRHAARSVILITLAVVCLEQGWSQDPGWPREKTVNGAHLVYYQPQVDAWNDFKLLDLRMAITITPAGGKMQPGVVTAEMQTEVNMDTHTVLLSHPLITGTYFPSLDPASSQKLGQLVQTFLSPTAMLTISLDRLVASANKPKPKAVAAVRNDPPAIYFSFKPALLLQLNGQPVKAPVANSNLEFVVNSNWPLFLDKSTSQYYLFDGVGWMTSSTLISGWTATTALPAEMAKVPADPNWKDLKPYIPAPPGSAANFPVVYYSTTPAEVVVFGGKPNFAPIPGTQLVYATNTDSDVFKYTPTGAFDHLTSGRWFSAPTALGPWSFASNSLPQDFANIPLASPPGRVLASVPGTPEAEDAVLLAQIPTTATVDSAKAAASVKVAYSGSPQFAPIPGTSLTYATNTPDRVIQVGSLYYLCFQGVWFMSTTPQGPWQTAPSVPPEIYTIPPSSPVYNVTYVTQTTVNGVVVASYTAGYYGVYVTPVGGAVIVTTGTGYIYPPVVVVGVAAYPIYYPYPATYGVATFYSPYTGAYGVAHSAYGPYGSATWGAAYNPTTGTYARGASVSNAYGTQKVAQAYNPYTGNYGATHQGSNAYGSWGNSVVSNGNNTVYTQHQTNANGTVATAQSTAGGKAGGVSTAYGNTAAGKTSNGDMYAGHDGNVYKNTGSGWETYNNGSWAPVQKPTNTTSTANETNQQKMQSNPNYSSDQQKVQSNPNYASDQQKAQSNPNYATDQQKAQSYGQQQTNPNGSYSHPSGSSTQTNQQKMQSNPNYASGQQKVQSNPNYASDQQKAQSNPNYSADQQKAKSYGQQPTSSNGAYSHPSGSASTSDLDKQAQDRQRGAQQSQRYSQNQRGASSGGSRSYGGGARR